ncbi:hypothetical protein [Actinopolyspora halophila]|uniref:hypothetical protein n=1 Tax=Actinopolyspora halophila TaxID=1850 RepID=UPI000366D785|nr:hypothetical protein [Actinopolyspora halophila]
MPAPIGDDKRADILDDIREEKLSRNAIARKHGVNPETVRNVATANGYDQAFSRLKTEKATRAHTADLAARRAELKASLLDDAEALRQRAWSEYTYYERGATGPEQVTLDLPPLAEVRQAYTALGIAVDKSVALDKHDGDSGADDARSMLGSLASGLQAAYDKLTDETTEDDGS